MTKSKYFIKIRAVLCTVIEGERGTGAKAGTEKMKEDNIFQEFTTSAKLQNSYQVMSPDCVNDPTNLKVTCYAPGLSHRW